MSMRALSYHALARRLAVTVSAVAIALSVSGQAAAQKAEVIHWWTSAGESAAVRVFADAFTAAGGTWIDAAVAGGAAARAAAISRIVGGKPPTMSQFNTGKQFDDLVEGKLLNDLQAEATAGNWTKLLPASFAQAASRDGKFYAMPVNIHGQNWLWYNRAIFEKAGIAVPTSFDDLIPALEKARAAGVVPLAFSSQKNWERNLFGAVMVGRGGAAMFRGILEKRDVKVARSPEFIAVAEYYRSLKAYTDPGATGRNWNDATSMVITGKAAMQFMGDWAKGEFTAAGLTPGKEYGCAVLGQGYIMGGDVFLFPKTNEPGAAEARKILARVMMEPATQIAFAQKKGSVPVRQDLDTSKLDLCAQAGMKIIADSARQVPSMDILAPAALVGAFEDAITEFWNKPAMTAKDFSERVAKVLADAL